MLAATVLVAVAGAVPTWGIVVPSVLSRLDGDRADPRPTTLVAAPVLTPLTEVFADIDLRAGGHSAVGRLHGDPMAIVSDEDHLLIGDIATGELVGTRLFGEKPITAVAVGELDGTAVAVTGTYATDQSPAWDLQVWDLAAREPIGEPFTGHTGMVTSIVLGEVAGDPVAMSGSLDGELRVWNLTTGEQRGEPLTGHTGAVTSIAISQLASATVAISSSSDWTVRVWDLATGEQISWPAGDRGPAGSALALGRIGDVRIVMTDGRWPVGVWNAVNGTPIDDLQSPHGAVTAVTYAELDGAPVAVSGHRDGAMRVWDLSVLVAGELLDEPLIGEVLAAHPDRVTSLAASEVAGAPVIVSSGLDGSILVWRLR